MTRTEPLLILGLYKEDTLQIQDKSSDIEQQPPFGDCTMSNIQPQNRGGGSKPTGTSYNFDKVRSGAPDGRDQESGMLII